MHISSIKSFTLIFRATLFAAFALFSGYRVWGQPVIQTFTTSSTFVIPPNVTSITVECWGAGGRGGRRTAGNNVALAAGGGGAYSKGLVTVVPGQSYTVNVGAGSTSTAAGGDSWFGSALTILAKGGNSVADNSNTPGAGGLASGGVGDIRYNGGNGATGTGGSFGGGGGSSAGSALDGNYTNTTTNIRTGATAPIGGGSGGLGAAAGVAGQDGIAPGGGGGGGYRAVSTQAPGDGANGQIVITYTAPVTFTADGIYAIPAGITQIKVECWGGGGGGGSRTTNGRAGGGGGGAYASSIVNVVPLNAYPVVVGTGGISAAISTDGESSSFGTTMVVGAGGKTVPLNTVTGGAGGTIAASTGTIRNPGGAGANSETNYTGGGGGGAGSTGPGGNAPTADANNGAGGTGMALNGGNGGTGINASTNGNLGNSYGGGGGGARRNGTNVNGGSGAQGLIIITLPANVALTSSNQVSAGNVFQGTTKWPVYSFEAGVTTSNAFMTSLSFTTAGTYNATDVIRFQLWFSTTNNFASAGQLGGNITSTLGAGLHTFAGLNQVINAGTSGYFWITTDIVNTATANATLSVNAIVPANLIFELTPFYAGGTTNGGTQTILPVPRMVIADASPQVPIANVNQGTIGHQIYRFTTAVTTANATLNSLAFATAGTYAAIDVINFKLWYNTSNDFSTALQVGSPIIGTLGTGSHTFSGLNLTTGNGTTGYFWITTDIAPFPGSDHTIRVNAITTNDLSYSTVVFHSGTTSIAGYQTIKTGSGVLLASNYPAVSANSLWQGSTGQRVFKFSTIAISAVTLTGVTFTTSGTYVASDIVNFKLIYNTVNSTVGATTLATLATGLGTGSHTFPAFSQATAANLTGYFWITADIAAGASPGHTLVVNAITTANLTYSGTPSKNGSTYAGGIQTIQTKLDTDADGSGDIYDLDDDNDGIPDYNENLSCNTAVAELFPNSNFDAGNTGFYSGYGYVIIVDQSSLYPEGIYAITPNANLGHNAFANCTGHGNMMVVNGSSNPNLIVWSSGTIVVTPNTDYTLTINLTSVNPANPAQLIFNVNGENIGLQFNATGTNCVWVPGIAIWNSGSNTSATFDIINLNLAPGGNDFAIDDISCKYKIDCDSDGDGMPDRMDVDSDNDGIYDVVEAGGTATANGTISGFTDLDLDGLSDNVDDRSSGSGGTDIFNGIPLPNPDTDADTYPNIIDRESDGDGCYDAIEAGFTDGDNDGILGSSPVTVNSKGIVTSAAGYTAPLDANSDGTRDYVQKLPLITVQPVDRSICTTSLTGTTFPVTATNTGGTYQWQVSTNCGGSWADVANDLIYSGATTATLTISSMVTVAFDRYMYRLLLSNNAFKCSPFISSAVTLRVSGSVPAISGSISGDAVVCPNATGLVYSISTVPSAISYAWAVPAGWTILSGQNTEAITVSSGISGGNVVVTATNACGTGPAVSLAISINTPSPTFTAPVSGSACQSANVTYTTQSGKTNYVWTIGGTTGVDYTITSGGSSTDPNLVVKWLTTGSKTVTVNYTSGGCQGITPASSTITINANVIIMTQPSNPAVMCAGTGSSAINITTSGTVTGYQWQVSSDGGTIWNNLSNTAPYSNVTTSSMTITSPSVALNNAQYRCQVTGSCGAATSNAAILTVIDTPAPTVNAGSAAACTQITANWTASANATGYYLDVSTVNTFVSFVAGYNNRDILNVSTFNVTGLTAGTTFYYRIRAYNTCGTSVNSATATYATLPATPAAPGAITGVAAQCPALTGQTYSITAVPNATAYTWTIPAGWTVTAGAGTTSITVTIGAAGQNGNITVTAGNSCGTSAASTLAVAVNPIPVISNKSTSVYSGLSFSVTPVNGTDIVPAGTAYSWPLPVVTGGITGGATGTSAANISGTLVNPGSSAETATYTITPTAAGCPGNTFTVTVTVNAIPVISNMSTTVCSGTAFSLTPVNGTDGVVPAGTTYSWPAPVVTGGITGGSTGSDANAISGTLSNPTNSVQTATYNVTPKTGTYSGSTFTVTVTVNPVATINPMIGSVCSGMTLTLTPANGTNGTIPAGITYSWPAPSVTGGLTGGASGTNANSINVTLVNPTASAQTATYTITPASGSCSGNSFSLTVTVNALPVVSIAGETTVCESTTITLEAGIGFASYQWKSGATVLGTQHSQDITTEAVSSGTPVTESYSVTVTDSNGCESSDSQDISVYHTPETGPAYNVPNN